MPVRVTDIDLWVPGGGTGLHDHAVRVVWIGILQVTFLAKELHCRAITWYANREMDIARVERLFTESGTIVNDQVKLLGIADLKPGTRKIEWRPRDLLDTQDLAVKISRPLDVRDRERNVVNGGDFHGALLTVGVDAFDEFGSVGIGPVGVLHFKLGADLLARLAG